MNSKTFHYIQEYFVQIHFIPSCLCKLCQTKHSAKPGVHNKIFCSSISQFFLNVYHKCHNLHKLHKKVYQYTLQVAIYLPAKYILPTLLVYLKPLCRLRIKQQLFTVRSGAPSYHCFHGLTQCIGSMFSSRWFIAGISIKQSFQTYMFFFPLMESMNISVELKLNYKKCTLKVRMYSRTVK